MCVSRRYSRVIVYLRVYSCVIGYLVYASGLSVSYVFKRCLKICSHIYHVFRIIFFCCMYTFFVFFSLPRIRFA